VADGLPECLFAASLPSVCIENFTGVAKNKAVVVVVIIITLKTGSISIDNGRLQVATHTV